MIIRRINPLRIAISLLLIVVSSATNAQSADSIASLMFEKTQQIKTLSYTMTKEERISGELQKQVAFVKLSRVPFKVYTKQISPDEGLEVLYVSGNETALINPNGFPWFNIRLDPYGHRMTKNQHHTIFDSGFDKFISILNYLFKKYEQEIETMASVKTHTTMKGKECWLLEFNNPNFKIIDYTVKKDESLMTIGDERFISAYMIMTLNKDIDNYNDVEPGQTIKIPSDYSPKMTLLIDKKNFIPYEIVVYGKAHIFENYKFSNIKINPTFSEKEFTPECESYGF